MGTPTSVSSYGNKEIWYFDNSTVTFKDDKVYEWNNTGENLKVFLSNSDINSPPLKKYDLLERVPYVLGTPKRIFKFPNLYMEIWHYQNSSITFRYGMVYEWNNVNSELRIIDRPQFLFKIGEDKNLVLKSTGNPSTIYCNLDTTEDLWFYESDSLCIFFKNSKVAKYVFPVQIKERSSERYYTGIRDINDILNEFYGYCIFNYKLETPSENILDISQKSSIFDNLTSRKNLYNSETGIVLCPLDDDYYKITSDKSYKYYYPSYYSGGGSGRSHRSSSSSGEKTVHVNSYTRKDGTYVKSYNRRPPSH
jgi:hypothetical protein